MFSKFKVQDVNLVANLQQELHQVKSWAAQVIWESNNWRTMAEQQIANLQGNLKKAEQRIQELKGSFVLNNSKQSYWSLTPTGRWRRKQKIGKFIKEKLKTLPKEFVPIEIRLRHTEGEDVLIRLQDEETEEEISDADDNNDDTSLLVTRKVLAAKDEGLISDEAYHNLRMSLPDESKSALPSIAALKKERKIQNGEIRIIRIPQAKCSDGCRRTLSDLLTYLMSVPSVRDAVTMEGNTISARFAADGRRTSAKIGSVMAVINLLHEGCNTVDYQYTVALYNGKEDYDELKECLGATFQEVKNLQDNGIIIDGLHFNVEWVICCDWKFLALVYGLNAACSKYFCIWCHCIKDMISNFDVEDWPIQRTLETCNRNHKENQVDKRKGSQKKPLLEVDFKSVVVDTLHLFLRIMGNLFLQIIDIVVVNDKKLILEKEMEKINIAFKFYEVQNELAGESETKWTKLDGKDLRKVLSFLDIQRVVSGISNIDGEAIEELWSGFKTLLRSLGAKPGERNYLKAEEFKTKAKEWATLFVYVHNSEDVTPYIHTLVYHVPQFLAKYGNISQFCCQGVEKKNHVQNQYFHRASQKGGRNSKYTEQILQKENRLLFVKKHNLKRVVRKYQVKSNTGTNNVDDTLRAESPDEDQDNEFSNFDGFTVYLENETEEG